MNTALMVDKLHSKGCKFMLTRNFKDSEKIRVILLKHNKAVSKGRQRKIIVMVIQNELLPDYSILVTSTYPNIKEVEQFGFYPVRKDRANWIPIQYLNRDSLEHLSNHQGDFEHTTNHAFLGLQEVNEYIKLAEKQEQIKMIYK